ncbi:tRNA methyltransferase, partial [Globisporangium splendens]
MAGQSRAAQRREKQKKSKQLSPSAANAKAAPAKNSGASKQPQKKQSAYHSDRDSDDDQFGDAALAGVLPLKSLEDAEVRDFVSELDQNASAIHASKKASKRTRAELAQHEIDKKKKRYREDKAQKIVWRKFDRENRTFEQYYQELLQLPADEWTQFVASLKEPTPIHVRVNGNYRSLSEIVTGTLETDFDMSSRTVKLASGDEKQVEFAPVPWTGNKTLWKLSIDSKSFRKSEPLKDLSNYFRAQSHLGLLLRQEPATCILSTFLQVKPGFKVLDLCGGGEHRAPMIVEALTADDAPQTGLLVVNERDASVANVALRNLSRTLALSRETVVTAHKALEFPQPHDGADGVENALFDRVICTAPCSGDGLIRKIPERWRTWSPSYAFKFHGSQVATLTKAMSLVKVGGSVLYSTRSFNPIENEAVVAELLRSGEDAYELIDVSGLYPDLKRTSGCTTWKVLDEDMEAVESWDDANEDQKRSLRATMWPPSVSESKKMHLDRCVRVLPHQNDTHGLFVAVIKKTKTTAAVPVAGPTPAAGAASKADKKKVKAAKKILGSFSTIEEKNLKVIRAFFGLSATNQLTRSHFMERSGFAKDKSVHLVTPAVSIFLDDVYNGRVSVYKAGVEVLRRTTTGYDLVDDGARALLPFLSRRVIQLQMDEFSSLLTTKEMWLKNASDAVREVLAEMPEGSLAVVLDDMEPAQTADQDIVLVATKRHSSYSLTSTSAAIARVKSLLSELNTGDEDGDGYDSFEYED